MARNKPNFDELAQNIGDRHVGRVRPKPTISAPAPKAETKKDAPKPKKVKAKRSFKSRVARKFMGLTAISAVLGYGFGAVQTGEFDDPIGAYAETAHDLNTAWDSKAGHFVRDNISNAVNSLFEKDAPAETSEPVTAPQAEPVQVIPATVEVEETAPQDVDASPDAAPAQWDADKIPATGEGDDAMVEYADDDPAVTNTAADNTDTDATAPAPANTDAPAELSDAAKDVETTTPAVTDETTAPAPKKAASTPSL